MSPSERPCPTMSVRNATNSSDVDSISDDDVSEPTISKTTGDVDKNKRMALIS